MTIWCSGYKTVHTEVPVSRKERPLNDYDRVLDDALQLVCYYVWDTGPCVERYRMNYTWWRNLAPSHSHCENTTTLHHGKDLWQKIRKSLQKLFIYCCLPTIDVVCLEHWSHTLLNVVYGLLKMTGFALFLTIL